MAYGDGTGALKREEFIPLFASPLMVHKWPNADELNAKLRHVILERERAMPGRNVSNVGGWQSDHDFRRWSGEAGKVCVDQVTAMVNHATSKVHGPRRWKPSVTWGIDAWANVNRQGNYNIPHSHPNSTWSCVYYVDTGDADMNNEKSGVITFLNPNSASSVSFFPETVGDKFNLWPEPGTMLVFPSYLVHLVHPYTGKRPRVSIALNFWPLRESAIPSPS